MLRWLLIACLHRIIEMKISGAATILTVDGGRRDGIDRSWHAWLVDEHGRRMGLGELQIIEVTDDAVRLRTTRSEISATMRVRLQPDVR
jgi:hypothetical protein